MKPLTRDDWFFRVNKGRLAHVRVPDPGEFEDEFLSLGPHDAARRLILLLKVPGRSQLGTDFVMRIPFLKFADESIADDDRTLLPIIDQLMKEAAEQHGLPWKGRPQ